MKKILIIVGTRPEAIKMAPVIKLLQKNSDCQTIVCATGQHPQMVENVMDLFQVTIDHTLQVMVKGQSLATLTARLYEQLNTVLDKLQPQWVLVHGDTTSAMVGSMVAYYHKCSIAHIEAGLRTHNLWAPFPEEINRQVIARVTNLHYAPTLSARENLIQEGIDSNKIIVTGNTIVDSLEHILQSDNESKFENYFSDFIEKRYILFTIHRRENQGRPLSNIIESIKSIATQNPKLQLVFVLHPNPKVSNPIQDTFGSNENVHLLPPQPYDTFIHLLSRATIIITDSGGIQEEAPSLGRPVVVLRETTERQESVTAGLGILVGNAGDLLSSTVERLLTDKAYYDSCLSSRNPYGDGQASQRIVDSLLNEDLTS